MKKTFNNSIGIINIGKMLLYIFYKKYNAYYFIYIYTLIDILFLLEEVAIFCHRNRVANKIFNLAHLYNIIYIYKISIANHTDVLTTYNAVKMRWGINCTFDSFPPPPHPSLNDKSRENFHMSIFTSCIIRWKSGSLFIIVASCRNVLCLYY